MKIAISKSITYTFISALLLSFCALASMAAATPPGTIITNVGAISYKTENGSKGYSDKSNEVQTVVGQAIQPVLMLYKSGPKEVTSGEEITYEITYKNDGAKTQANATGVVITDKLPALAGVPSRELVAFVGASDDGKYDAVNGTVTWKIDSLPFNKSGTVRLTVKVDENLNGVKTIENRASITCIEGSTFNASSLADVVNVSLEKIAPAEIFATQTINYEIKYKNDGNAPLENVTITDKIPEYTTFVSATGDYTQNDGVITWTIPQLAPGASGSFNLKVQPMEFIPEKTKLIKLPDGTIVTNEAEISAQGRNYDKSTTRTIVKNPLLYQEKRFKEGFDGSKIYEHGDIIPYVIIYRNESKTTTYKNVRIEDPIPAYAKFKNAPKAILSPQSGSVEKVTWLIDDLEPGEEGTVTLELEIDLSGVPAGSSVKVENVARIISDEPKVDREFYGPEVSAARGQASRALIEIEKSVDKKEASGGDVLTYTIKYRNVGDEKATGVSLEDTIPEHLTYVSASDAGTFNGDTRTVTWQLGELLSSDTWASVNLQVRVVNATCGVTIENQALAKWAQRPFDPAYSNKVQTVTPNCQISLVANPKIILGNGRSISHLTSQVLVKGGKPIPDGTKVTFVTDRGSFKNPNGTPTRILTVTTISGIAETDLYSEIISTFKVTSTLRARAEAAGEASAAVDFVSGAIAGVVTDQRLGQNVSGALIRIPNNPLPDETETTTDSNGEYSLLIADPLKYELAYMTTDFEGAKLEIFDDVFITPSGGRIYYPQNIISGAVLEYESERPIPSVTLRLINARDKTVVRANISTDSQGRYEIKKLDKGRYRIEVTQSPKGLAPDGPLTVNADRDGQVVINANIVLGPQREITKSVDKNVAFPGDSLTYNITYKNNGERLENLRLIDSIPNNTEYVQATPEAKLKGNEIIWTLPAIDEYKSFEVQFTVKVKNDAKESATIENQAYISPLNNPGDVLYSNVVKTEVNRLNIKKSASADFVSPGGEVTFTLTASNPSTIAADGVYIVDFIPSGVSVINISDGGTREGERLKWNIGSLSVNGAKSVTTTLRIAEDIAVDEINNTARVLRNDVPQDESSLSIPINRLYIKKTADKAEVAINETITYMLEYGNKGNVPLTNVEIRDALPKEVEWIEGGSFLAEQHVVVFKAGNLPQRSSRLVSYKVKTTGCSPGVDELINTASIRSKEVPTPVTDSLSIPIVPSITLNKSVNNEFSPAGERLEYTITYANGGGKSSNTIIRDRIPTNTTYVEASGNVTGQYFEATGEVVWNIGDMICKDSGVLNLLVRINDDVPAGTVIENVARLTNDREGEITSTATTTIVKTGLDILKTANPASVTPGGEITYTITYANTGDAKLENVLITDKVPENTVLIRFTGESGKLDGNLVTWSLGTLSPEDTGSVKLVVKVIKEPTQSLLDSKTIANSATIEGPPGRNKKTSTVETPVEIQEGLQAKKEALPARARPGDTITYTITCSNDGNIDYTDVKIEDTLPPELEFLSLEKGTGEYKDGKITFDVGKLVSNESRQFKYKTQIKTDIDATKIHQVKNVVIVTSKQGDLPPVEEIVQAIPNFLKVTLAGNKRVMEIGEMVAFVIDVENTSVDTTVEEVTVVDILPPGVKYIEGTSRIDGEKVDDPKIETVKDPKTGEPRQKLTWEIGKLEPKDKSRLVFRATLEPTISDRTFGIENTVKAYGKIKDGDVAVGQEAEVASDEAKWPIRIRRGMFDRLGQIIGKVFVDENYNKFQDGNEKGYSGARLYMEDGTEITTDEKGKYHVTQVEPGYHVIKIDKNSIEGYKVIVHTTRYTASQGTTAFNGEPKLGQFVSVPENGTAKIDFVLKALPAIGRQVEKKQAPRIKPTIEQPQRLVLQTPVPSVEIEPPVLAEEQRRQVPKIKPEIEQPITGEPRGTGISFGTRPVRVTLPIVTNPISPPYVRIEFKPDRIPAGDPKIIVTPSRGRPNLLNVIAKHPDGRTIALKKEADGKGEPASGFAWQAEFTVPFDTPEGPYPFTFWITDETGREWYFRKTVMVDNSIPNVYAEFTPKIGKRGAKTQLKVTLLIDAKTVYVRFRDIKKTLYLKREKRFHWSTSYTIPKNIEKGWHNAQVVVVPKEDARFRQRARVAYKVE